MYGSPAMSKDLDLSFSDLNGQHQLSSGLLRYRSAPSSLFEDFLPPRSSSPEADTVLARFLSSDLRDDKPGGRGSPRYPPPLPQPQPPQAAAEHGGVAPDPRMLYQQPRQQLPGHGAADGSYRAVEAEQLKSGAGLVRQSSSPAGLFSHLNVENGYAFMRSMSGLRNGNGSIGEAGANRLKNQISFSSRQSSIMSQISEIGSEGMGASSPEESSLASNGSGRCYIPGYPITSWDDSPMLPDNFSNLKRAREASHNQSEPQNGGEIRSHASGQLTHQFSLPKTPSEIAAMEKFLQFQDAVPCKIRAKRGCATHPRSIAERVRRTRISERMRKLQELVPNMDKQTNTADMLDLAVDYIKELQRQVKSLSESRASCSCSSGKQKPYTAA